MWLARELVCLVLRIAVAAAVALALAAILAAAGVDGFVATARILCIVSGCMLLAMGAIGRGSNVERYADANVTKVAWGTIPGFDSFARRRPHEPTLAAGAVLFFSGLAVLAIGLAL